MENYIGQPTYTTIYSVPTAGDKFDPSTWTTAITTVPVEPNFQFVLDKNYTNHYVYWGIVMRNETASAESFAGVGIRWYDRNGNVVHNDGVLCFIPRRDTIFQEISVVAPGNAVRGELIWIGGTSIQWSGNDARLYAYHRWTINWN